MKLERDSDLWLILALSIILLLSITFATTSPIRLVLGIPFVLLFPGYLLVAMLWPKKTELDDLERLALSFGLSIAVVVLIGLALAWPTSIGLTENTASVSIFGYIVLSTLIAWYRRIKTPEAERFSVTLEFKLPSFKSEEDKVFYSMIIVAFLIGALALSYIAFIPKSYDEYSEFYILDTNGTTENYPRALAAGENGTVLIGVRSHERSQTEFIVVIRLVNETGARENETLRNYTFPLDDGTEWEQKFEFNISRPGHYQLKFVLYKDAIASKGYRECHLWVTVSA